MFLSDQTTNGILFVCKPLERVIDASLSLNFYNITQE